MTTKPEFERAVVMDSVALGLWLGTPEGSGDLRRELGDLRTDLAHMFLAWMVGVSEDGWDEPFRHGPRMDVRLAWTRLPDEPFWRDDRSCHGEFAAR